MSKKETGGGWSFPKNTEVYSRQSGKRDTVRERQHGDHRGAEYRLIAEFPVYENEGFNKTAWTLAKRVAYDLVRTTYAPSAVVCFVERDAYQRKAIKVYQKLEF